MKKIFIDTMVFRLASSVRVRTHANEREGFINKAQTGRRAPTKFLMYDYEITEMDQSKEEAWAIREIARLAKNGECHLVYSHEVNLELFCQPMVDIAAGRFHGAPCRITHSPILKVDRAHFDPTDRTLNPLHVYPNRKYPNWDANLAKLEGKQNIEDFLRDVLLSSPIESFEYSYQFMNLIAGLRETTGYQANTPELMYPVLRRFDNLRYKQILFMLNADGIGDKKKWNTYLDALHLLSAEEEECDVFLTLDRAIRRRYSSKRPIALKPSETLALITN